jgi:hypothetical protein
MPVTPFMAGTKAASSGSQVMTINSSSIYIRAALALGTSLGLPFSAHGTETRHVAMTKDVWQADGKVDFAQREGLAEGLLQVEGDGKAVLKGANFRDGTIEFDIRPLDDGMPGIEFHRQTAQSMEILYLRPSPECPVAQDCIQYVPRVHGVMPWEMYPNFQTAAPVAERGWSHIKLVISGRRMNVFVNQAARPTMSVGQLEGDATEGGLALVGPAAFANLVITAGATENLPATPVPDPAAGDTGFVRQWLVSPPSPQGLQVAADLSQMPPTTADWQPISAEPLGLINLSRRYGSPTDRSTGALVWLKTTIHAATARTVRVSMAYLHEATVFANGKMVFNGQNLYVPGTPIGRISLDNASYDLPLQPGDNQIVVALNNILIPTHNHYGWGMEFHLNDTDGIVLPGTGSPRVP